MCLGLMKYCGPAASQKKTSQTAQLTRDKSLPLGFTKQYCRNLRGDRVETGLPVCSSHTGPDSWIQPCQLDQSNDFRKQRRGRLHLLGFIIFEWFCKGGMLQPRNGSVELMTGFILFPMTCTNYQCELKPGKEAAGGICSPGATMPSGKKQILSPFSCVFLCHFLLFWLYFSRRTTLFPATPYCKQVLGQ